MSNGFTNLPTSLLGAVNIGGALTVAGSLTVGASPNIVRVGNFTGYGPGVSGNLGFDAATRDNAAVSAALHGLGANANTHRRKVINAAGNAQDHAYAVALAANPPDVLNNNNAAEQTLFSVLIRAGMISANSILIIRTASIVGGASGGSDTIRLKAGATVLDSLATSGYNGQYWQWVITFRNALNSQRIARTLVAVSTAFTNTTAAVDFSTDQTVTLTLQAAAALGNNTWFGWDVQLLNTVGPL